MLEKFYEKLYLLELSKEAEMIVEVKWEVKGIFRQIW